MTPRRLAVVLPFTPGPVLLGVEREAVRVANALATAGDDVTMVVTERFYGAATDERVTSELVPGVELRRLAGHLGTQLRGAQPSGAPLWVAGLREAARDQDACIVWNAGWPITLLLSGMGRRGWPPTVYRPYWHPPRGRSRTLNGARNMVMARAFRRANVLLAATRAEGDDLSKLVHGQVPVVVAPPGVDGPLAGPAQASQVRHSLGINDGTLVVTQLGRPSAFKGTEAALASVDRLRRRGFDAVLLLVGTVTDTAWLDDRIDSRNAHSWVLTTGAVDEFRKSELLVATDVLVMLSDYEAFGFVALEAIVHGASVVSYDDFPSSPFVAELGGALVARRAGSQGIAETLERLVPGVQPRGPGEARDEFLTWSRLSAEISRLVDKLITPTAAMPESPLRA